MEILGSKLVIQEQLQIYNSQLQLVNQYQRLHKSEYQQQSQQQYVYLETGNQQNCAISQYYELQLPNRQQSAYSSQQYQQQSSNQLTIITQQSQQSNSVSQSILLKLQESNSSSYTGYKSPILLSKSQDKKQLQALVGFMLSTQSQQQYIDDNSQQQSFLEYQAKISIYQQMKKSKIFTKWKLLVYRPILVQHHHLTNIKHNKQNICIQSNSAKPSLKITSEKHHRQICREQFGIKKIVKMKYDCFRAWRIEVKYKKAVGIWNRKIYRAFFVTTSYLLQVRLRWIYLQEILKVNRVADIIKKLKINKSRNIGKVQNIIRKQTLVSLMKRWKRKGIIRATNKLAQLTYQLKIKKKYWAALLNYTQK